MSASCLCRFAWSRESGGWQFRRRLSAECRVACEVGGQVADVEACEVAAYVYRAKLYAVEVYDREITGGAAWPPDIQERINAMSRVDWAAFLEGTEMMDEAERETRRERARARN